MVVVGSALGFVSAKAVVWLIQRGLIPDYLHNAVTLMVVVVSFTLANGLHHEAGLFTVTVMGIVMANQKAIIVQHIIEFKETLTGLRRAMPKPTSLAAPYNQPLRRKYSTSAEALTPIRVRLNG